MHDRARKTSRPSGERSNGARCCRWPRTASRAAYRKQSSLYGYIYEQKHFRCWHNWALHPGGGHDHDHQVCNERSLSQARSLSVSGPRGRKGPLLKPAEGATLWAGRNQWGFSSPARAQASSGHARTRDLTGPVELMAQTAVGDRSDHDRRLKCAGVEKKEGLYFQSARFSDL